MQPATQQTTVSAEILSAMNATNELFNSQVILGGNMDVLDRVYTSGARILPPANEMITGRAAVKSFWRDAIAGLGIRSAVLTTVEATQAGDGIVEIGRAELMLADSTMTVKYVVFWKQEDGAWKWHIDIWNQV